MTEVRPIPTETSPAATQRPFRTVALLRSETLDRFPEVARRLERYGVTILAADGEVGLADLQAQRADAVILETKGASEMALIAELTEQQGKPVIAAVVDLGVEDMRALMRVGVADVIPLPPSSAELRQALDAAGAQLARAPGAVRHGCIAAFVGSVGGAGATFLAVQAAGSLAKSVAAEGKSVCLLDFDLQFGGVALQLDLSPAMTLADVMRAKDRLDAELFRSVAARHETGLSAIAAPGEVVPLEAMSEEMALHIVDLAEQMFDYVVLDLPTSWTSWSLALLNRADIAFMVTELTVPSVRQAKRQFDLFARHDMIGLPLRIVANRYQRGLFKAMDLGSIEEALQRPIDFRVANDFPTASSAIDHGQMIEAVRRRGKLRRDIDILATAVRDCRPGQ